MLYYVFDREGLLGKLDCLCVLRQGNIRVLNLTFFLKFARMRIVFFWRINMPSAVDPHTGFRRCKCFGNLQNILFE